MTTSMIIGCGGIGLAVAKKMQSLGQEVVIVSKQEELEIENVDRVKFSDLETYFSRKLPENIINTIGMLHDNTHMPEKNIQQFSGEWLQKSINVNVMPTAQIAQALAEHITPETKLKMLTISARLSSISDNRLGGWYSYRMSKAALNMLIKNIAIEWGRLYPSVVVCGYHPGTVDTDLTRPFREGINKDQLFSPDKSAEHLLKILKQITPKDSGNLFDWGGNVITF